jgi:uncharacterized protein YecT (DUF1311 family)
VRRCAGLLTIALIVLGCSAPAKQEVLAPPRLPVRASPNSVASFPCPRKPVSTLELEACDGRRLLALGRSFNRQANVLWSMLDPAGRRAFARAHRAWLSYRDQRCTVDARAYAGGTAAGPTAGRCRNALTAAWLRDVESSVALYCQGKVRAGRFRNCPRHSP